MPDFQSFVEKNPNAFQDARAAASAAGEDGVTIPPVPDDGITIPPVPKGTAKSNVPSMQDLMQLWEKHMGGGDTQVAPTTPGKTPQSGGTAVEPYVSHGEAIPPESPGGPIGGRASGPTIEGEVASEGLPSASAAAKGAVGKLIGKLAGRIGGPIAGVVGNSTPLNVGEREEMQKSNEAFRTARDAPAVAATDRNIAKENREADTAPSTSGERPDLAGRAKLSATQKLLAPGGLKAPTAAQSAPVRPASAAKGSDFNEAFKAARAQGLKIFPYRGKSYSTQTADGIKKAATAKVNPPAKAGPDLNEKMLSLYRSDPTFASLSPAEQVARASAL